MWALTSVGVGGRAVRTICCRLRCSGLGRLDSGDSEGNAAAMGLAAVATVAGAAAVAEGRVRRENWEPDSALSPRGDSVTSLSQDFEAPSSYPQGRLPTPSSTAAGVTVVVT